MRIVNVGICGIGTVGSGVFNVLSRNLTEINSRANCQINISQIACRKDDPDIDKLKKLFGANINKESIKKIIE